MSLFHTRPTWIVMFILVTACGNTPGDNPAARDANQPDPNASAPYVAPREPFPFLGSSASFAVLAEKSVVNVGATIVYGDIGVSNASAQITGSNTTFNQIKLTGGKLFTGDATALAAQTDSKKAYLNLKNKACDHDLSGQNLGGMTLTPGAYCFTGDARLSGIMTLDFQGNKHANFVFQVARNFDADESSAIRLINSGESCNVFWQIPGTATLGNGSNLVGAFMVQGDIKLNSGTMLNGKVNSQSGNVLINVGQIYNNFCPWAGSLI